MYKEYHLYSVMYKEEYHLYSSVLFNCTPKPHISLFLHSSSTEFFSILF